MQALNRTNREIVIKLAKTTEVKKAASKFNLPLFGFKGAMEFRREFCHVEKFPVSHKKENVSLFKDIPETSWFIAAHRAHMNSDKVTGQGALVPRGAFPVLKQHDKTVSFVKNILTKFEKNDKLKSIAETESNDKTKSIAETEIKAFDKADISNVSEIFANSIQKSSIIYSKLNLKQMFQVKNSVIKNMLLFYNERPNWKFEDLLGKMNGMDFTQETNNEHFLEAGTQIVKYMLKADFYKYLTIDRDDPATGRVRKGSIRGFFTTDLKVTASDVNVLASDDKFRVVCRVTERTKTHKSTVAPLHDDFSYRNWTAGKITGGTGNSTVQCIAPEEGIHVEVVHCYELDNDEILKSNGVTVGNPENLNKDVNFLIDEFLGNKD